MAAVQYSRTLAELRRADEPRYGGKSASLGELLAAGIPVPPGFALSASSYQAFVVEAGLGDRIAAAMDRAGEGDLQAIGAASRAIGAAMSAAELPGAVREEIARAYAALAETVGADSPPVAVRSSALGEDSEEATFAGQQDSYLWVRTAERVCEAVRDCWASLYTPAAISYRARLEGAGPRGSNTSSRPSALPAMGVTVQAMVNAERSGVMFTCNPVSGDPSVVAVNAAWGLGLAVVGGDVTPDDYLVSKVTGEVVRARVHDKHIEYLPDPGGHGACSVDVPSERRRARCLDDEALAALVDVAKRVERHFGSRQDIEWAIARGQAPPDGLFVVQSRPVTASAQPERKPAPKSAIAAVMSTFGADVAKRRPDR
jgi:pyruvate, water dikinase